MNYQQETLIQLIKTHEGERFKAYEDSEGHLTVGYGHKVKSGDKDMNGYPLLYKNQPISKEQADRWFQEDLQKSIRQASSIPGFDQMSGNRQMAMIDLTFNMGFGWTTKFPNAYKLIKAGAASIIPEQKNNLWEWASNELAYKDGRNKSNGHSDWWQQTKTRAPKIVKMVKDG